MFTQTPTHIQARFQALQYRAQPITVDPIRQAQATRLVSTIKAICPGVYQVGSAQVSLWSSGCTCRAHRLHHQVCRHKLALWLDGEMQIGDPDPALYLKAAGIEEPEIIGVYARFANDPQKYRIQSTEQHTHDGKRWFSAHPLNDPENWTFCLAEDLYYLQIFYEV